MHPAALPLDQLERDCTVRRTRGSGPGGQHRNKVETAIVVEHSPTGLRGEATERRSQKANLETAWRRLRVALAVVVREPVDLGHGVPSDLWRGRCRGGKVAVNPEHVDAPALLAEALDVLSAMDWDVAPAAEALNVSRTQLVRFLAATPEALGLLNEQRTARGLRSLR